jgi:hypothetical protein
LLPSPNAIHDDVAILVTVVIEHLHDFLHIPIYPVIPDFRVEHIAEYLQPLPVMGQSVLYGMLSHDHAGLYAIELKPFLEALA